MKSFISSNKESKPCAKCPYTLGDVTFVQNPCPACEMNNYKMYEILNEDYRKQRGKAGKKD